MLKKINDQKEELLRLKESFENKSDNIPLPPQKQVTFKHSLIEQSGRTFKTAES